ncbi:MAG: hypothetical protein HRU38_15195 [Saccharospirillaceae bacterium]|nr:hypothetical protein [Pseudomonadales bacterium]NRB79988.1 hypothetical protein [Saccharospirillaceae bacterium]
MNMKKIAASLAITSLTCVVLLSSANKSELILGKWDCDFSMTEQGMSMDLNIIQNYLKDGTNSAVGTIAVANEAMGLDVAFSVEAESTWYIEGSYIYETITGGKVESLKESPFDVMFAEKDLLPIGKTESVEILELNDSTLRIMSDAQEFNCVR